MNDRSLEDAKAWLRERWEAGAECPCCAQFVKLYKRKLNSNMCVFLIGLVRQWQGSNDWVDYRSLRFRGRDYNYLKHWSLATCAETDETGTKKSSGLWKPTPAGVEFVHDRIPMPSHVFVYDNSVIKFATTTTTIRAALGDRFNYRELMAATPDGAPC